MRIEITEQQIEKGLSYLRSELYRRLKEKGYGSFSSKHEILGSIDEEFREFAEDVRKPRTSSTELWDLAVGSVFGAICIDNKTTEW